MQMFANVYKFYIIIRLGNSGVILTCDIDSSLRSHLLFRQVEKLLNTVGELENIGANCDQSKWGRGLKL